MKYVCPRCGKVIELSDDELMSQGNMIVCPSCLMEFNGDKHEYADLQSSKPAEQYYYGAAVSRNSQAMPVMTYCRFCGAYISENCNYCPVCGNRLAVTPQNSVEKVAENVVARPSAPAKSGQPGEYEQPLVPPTLPYMPSYRYSDFGQGQMPHRAKKKAPFYLYVLMVALGILFIWLLSGIAQV